MSPRLKASSAQRNASSGSGVVGSSGIHAVSSVDRRASVTGSQEHRDESARDGLGLQSWAVEPGPARLVGPCDPELDACYAQGWQALHRAARSGVLRHADLTMLASLTPVA